MTDPAGTIGFAVIVILYTVLGLLAAAGSASVLQKVFTGRSEQVFYGLFLVPIAGFYLAFVAYFGDASAWRTELSAVAVFSALGVLGTRNATILILGYPLHGLWDIVHELSAHGGLSLFAPGRLTEIPLAYGFFCLAYDVAIAFYFARRKRFWANPQPPPE